MEKDVIFHDDSIMTGYKWSIIVEFDFPKQLVTTESGD